MIIANVNNQILTLRVEGVVSDSVRFLTVKFNFNDVWRTKSKVAVFKSDTKDYPIIFADGNSMYLGDNVCIVPQEVIKHPCFSVSVYGVENNVLITTNEELVDVLESGYGDFLPEDPTPEIWNQLLMANSTFAHCPSGGSEGQVLQKSSDSNYDMVWGDTDGITKEEAEDEFVQKTVKINNKPLSDDISLDAEDVGALPDDTVIPVVDSDYDPESENAQSGTAVAEAVENKVDKITGKGLSTNDFNDYYKNKIGDKYEKPSTGIPKSDLASSVKESLSKADTALQSHQDISGKQDKFAEISENSDFRWLSLTKNTNISGHLGVPTPSWGGDVTNKDYVDDAISAINAKIPSCASGTNKLVSVSEMGDAISSVEAKHLYKTSSQGSFATKAELTAATVFYDADGTVATPTKNDVAYVLSDESHNNKSAKYVIASVNPLVWGFVITFSDNTFTQAQINAINSGITSADVTQIGENTSDIETKQDKLTAGSNITIDENNVISASGSSGSMELIEDFTPTQGAWTISRSAEPDGTPYNFSALALVITKNNFTTADSKRIMLNINDIKIYDKEASGTTVKINVLFKREETNWITMNYIGYDQDHPQQTPFMNSSDSIDARVRAQLMILNSNVTSISVSGLSVEHYEDYNMKIYGVRANENQ